MTLSLSPAPVPAPAQKAPLIAPAPAPFAFAATPAPLAAAAPAPSPQPALAVASLRAAAMTPLALDPAAPLEGAREAASASFDEARSRPEPFATPVFTAQERTPHYRLAPLNFEDLAASQPSAPPPARAPEAKPFLLRNYRLVRFFAAPLVRLVYAVRGEGLAHLPAGPALIVPNHVSFMDPILLSFALNRPMRFVMFRGIYETRGLQWLFRSLGAIPISPKDRKDIIEDSLYRARRALAAGETVVVFPEGQLTRDGGFSPFRRGFERVAAGTGAPVIPAHIDGMWGSAFSRRPGASFLNSLRDRLSGRRRVSVRLGPPLARADAALAREAVAHLAAP